MIYTHCDVGKTWSVQSVVKDKFVESFRTFAEFHTRVGKYLIFFVKRMELILRNVDVEKIVLHSWECLKSLYPRFLVLS